MLTLHRIHGARVDCAALGGLPGVGGQLLAAPVFFVLRCPRLLVMRKGRGVVARVSRRPRLARFRFAVNTYYVTFGVVMGLSG